MAFKLAFAPRAVSQLRKLDRAAAKRIVDYLEDVAALEDPRIRGKILTGEKQVIWRYRIGDYRALCDINSNSFIILTLEIGHRSQIYR